MDLTRRREFQGNAIAETRDRFAAHGIAVSDLGASSRLHEAEATVRAAQLDEGRRYIDLAHTLGTPYVRVFGDKLVAGEPREKTVAPDRGRATHPGRPCQGQRRHRPPRVPRRLHALSRPAGDPDAVGLPEVALLWDARHTVVFGQEAPAATWKALGRFVRHVHLKDSRARATACATCSWAKAGCRARDRARAVGRRVLGLLLLGWERRWRPENEEPEVAFPHYARVMADYLATALAG